MSVHKHPRRTAGLAVAVGLGLAVATGHGVAVADPSDSTAAKGTNETETGPSATGETTGSSATTGSNGATSAGQPSEPGGAATLHQPASSVSATGGAVTSGGGAGEDADAGDPEQPADDDSNDADDVAAGDAGDTSTTDEPAIDVTPIREVSESVAGLSDTSSRGSRGSDTPAAVNPTADVEPPPTTARTPSATPRAGTSTTAALTASAPATTATMAATSTVAPVVQTALAPPPAPAGFFGGIANAVAVTAATIVGFFSPSVFSAPLTPFAPLNSLLQFLYAARRPFFGVVSNSAPTATAGTQTQQTTGEVTGTVAAADADGDVVHFGIGQAPANGNVEVFADGSWVYVPSRQLSAGGGTDTFTVTVDDNHRALFQGGALDVFTETGRTTVPITVTVAARPDVNEIFKSFSVINLTGAPLVFRGMSFVSNDVNAPKFDSVLMPGESQSFEVSYYFTEDSFGEAAYSSLDNRTTVFAPRMTVGAYGGKKFMTCNTGDCEIESSEIAYLKDRPGTVIDIPAAQAQARAELLNRLCQDGGRASCSFDYKRTEKAYSGAHGVGNAIENGVAETQPRAITIKDDQVQTTNVSFGGKVSANIAKIISAELSSTYGRTVSTKYSFAQTLNTAVPGYTRTFVVGEQPVIRDHGDFTVKLGNTTFILRDVYLDSPDPNGQSRYTVYSEAYYPPAGSDDQQEPGLPTPAVDTAAEPLESAPVLVPAPRTGPAAIAPPAPAVPNSPLEVFAAVGRQVLGGFVNQAPTAVPVSNPQSSGGTVTGTLGAVDGDGDGLSYAVADAPTNGNVVVKADGTYVYTPDPAFADKGGADVFSVTVADNRQTVFGPSGTITVPVVVTVVSTKAPSALLTSSFDIVNATSIPLIFRGYSYASGRVDNGPRVGSILLPGQVQRFDVVNYGGATSVNPVYGTSTANLYEVQLTTSVLGREVRCFKTGRGACSANDDGTGLILKDSPGTVVDLTASQGADLVNRACGTTVATCEVKFAYPPVPATTNPHALGAAVINRSNGDVSTTFTVSEELSESTSFSVNGKLSVAFLSFLNAEFTASYGRTFTTTHTFTDTLGPVVVPKGQTRSVTFVEPVIRAHGDVTVTMGNTVFHVRDIDFDTPDKNGQGAIRISDKPLSDPAI